MTRHVTMGKYNPPPSPSMRMSPGSRPRPSFEIQGQARPAATSTKPRMMSARCTGAVMLPRSRAIALPAGGLARERHGAGAHEVGAAQRVVLERDPSRPDAQQIERVRLLAGAVRRGGARLDRQRRPGLGSRPVGMPGHEHVGAAILQTLARVM